MTAITDEIVEVVSLRIISTSNMICAYRGRDLQ